MDILDNENAIRKIDGSGLLANIRELPDQFWQSWLEAKKLTLPSHYIHFDKVILLGMGGSAIGASLLKSLLLKEEKVPITVVRDYTLPKYVDRNALVIAVSYSGGTEEVLTCFKEAARHGAKLIALSSDGELEKLASQNNAPFFRISYGSPPRAALGYLFVPLIAIFAKLGLLSLGDGEMRNLVDKMKERQKKLDIDVPAKTNLAKTLALKLEKKVPVIFASDHLAEVARRWKTQFNENAKHAAYFEVAPELCHNTMAGLDFPRPLPDHIFPVILRSPYAHPRNELRLDFVEKLLARHRIPFETIADKSAATPLQEMARAIVLGDYVSYYLAVLHGMDPTPIAVINELKDHLAKSS